MSVTAYDTTAEHTAEIMAGRDLKLAIVLRNTHPAWIVSEQANLAQNTCVFDVVFRYGGRWVRRRYIYDAEVDVLHFDGEVLFDESRLLMLSEDQLFTPPA